MNTLPIVEEATNNGDTSISDNNTQSLLDTELISLNNVSEEISEKPNLPVLEEEQEEEQRRISLRRRNPATTRNNNSTTTRTTRSSSPSTQSSSRKRKAVEQENESESDIDFDPTDWLPYDGKNSTEKMKVWYTKWYLFMKENYPHLVWFIVVCFYNILIHCI